MRVRVLQIREQEEEVNGRAPFGEWNGCDRGTNGKAPFGEGKGREIGTNGRVVVELAGGRVGSCFAMAGESFREEFQLPFLFLNFYILQTHFFLSAAPP